MLPTLNSRFLRPAAVPTLFAAVLAGSMTLAAVADDAKPAAAAPTVAIRSDATTGVWGDRLAKLREWKQKRAENNEPPDMAALQAYAKELLGNTDVSTLSVSEIESGWPLINAVPEAADKARARVAGIAKQTDADGALASMLLIDLSRSSPTDYAAAVKAAWDHPGFEQALDAKGMRSRFQAVGMLGALEPAARNAYAARVLEWSKKFGPTTSTGDLRFAPAYMKSLRDLGESVSPEQFEKARVNVLAVVKAASAKAEAAGAAEDVKQLNKIVARLDSPAMKGTLLDNPAPALTFRKVLDLNGTPTWNSLEDLKGKVVVLDFWATWCGPCVASFPNVRELRKHYSPEDVVIIGITSPQGAIHWKGKPKQDFKDDVNGEMATMIDYVKAMDMTWPVAFTEQEVFNPDYDVNGIPHLAIIDTTGKLRFNDLHPAMPLKEKTDKIDLLLKEAGKTPPPAPAPQAAPESK